MSKQPKMSVCRNCNAPIGKNARICPSCGAKNTKPFYQKWWFVLLIIIIIISLIGSMNRNKKEKFDWKDVELSDQLPKPKSNVGKVSSDSEDDCYIYVGKTSEDDFNTYIDECIEAGFSEDYQRGDYFYTASDATGNKLSVNYQGNKVMTVQLTKKVELEESEV